jgi:hypothetical protein
MVNKANTMTTATILKEINALPVNKRMEVVEKVLRTIRLETPQRSRRKKNPDNPSPSGDPWYDDPRNIAIVMEAIQSAKEEKGVTIEECPELSAIFSKYR